MKTTITWHNAGPHTIWGQLAAKLGREPTHREAVEEVQRIMTESLVERAEQGKLRHQRKR